MFVWIKNRRHIDPTHAWLYTGLALVLVPHIAYQTPGLSLSCGALFLWRLLHDFGWLKLPTPFIRIVIAVSSFAFVAGIHHTIIGRDAGVSLLLIMISLKLLEMTRDRDFLVSLCLGYFGVISGFLYNQSIIIGIYLLMAVVILTTALISFNKKGISRHSEKSNLKLALIMLLQAIPVALLIFTLFPRGYSSGWGLPQEAANAKTGLSNSMSPGKISQLTDNDTSAFRVEFKRTTPLPSQLYWRGPVFNFFDGETWSRSSVYAPLNSRDLPVMAQSPPRRYVITLEPHNLTWMFALDVPTRIPENSYINDEYELHSAKPIVHIAQYELESVLNYELAKQSLTNRHLYLQIPSGTGIKAQQLAVQMISNVPIDQPRDAALVQSALDYIRQQPFYYTRNAPLLRTDPIDEFLFSSRRGFCEHYASAFTFLMRAAGIPARVVTGYQGGEFNPIGNYLLVKQSDAHAWSEVWLKEKGWVRVDPTAVIPLGRIEHSKQRERFKSTSIRESGESDWMSSTWKKLRLATDNINHYWNKWFIGYNGQLQRVLLSWLGLQHIGWELLVALLFTLLGICLTIIGIYVIYRTQTVTDPIQKVYCRLCRKLKRKGIRKHSYEGAKTFSDRASRLNPEWTQALTHISQLYNKLRYGNPVDKKSLLSQLRREVHNFKP